MTVGLLGEDRLPPGPCRDLVLAVRVYYDAANRPSTRAIRDHMPRHDKVSHQAVQTTLSGQTVPRWSSLERLVRALVSMRPAGKQADLNRVWDELRPLWRAADAVRGSAVSGAQGEPDRVSPASHTGHELSPEHADEPVSGESGDAPQHEGRVDPEDWLSLPRLREGRPEDLLKTLMAYADARRRFAGDTAAMVRLASLLTGRGHVVEAEHWFLQAANAGDTTAMVRLADLLAARSYWAEIEQSQRRAADAAAAGDTSDKQLWSNHADNLKALSEDSLRQAADTEDTPDTGEMARLADLLGGDRAGVERWLRQAADAGDSAAMLRLAKLLDNPRHDVPEAEQWFRRAADAGNVKAMLSLASLLYGRKDPESDVWIHRASEIETNEFLSRVFGPGIAEAMGWKPSTDPGPG